MEFGPGSSGPRFGGSGAGNNATWRHGFMDEWLGGPNDQPASPEEQAEQERQRLQQLPELQEALRLVAARQQERQQRLAQQRLALQSAEERTAGALGRGRHMEAQAEAAEAQARAAVQAAEEQVDCLQFLQHVLDSVQQPGGVCYERELLRDVCSSLRGGACSDQQLLALGNRVQEHTEPFILLEDAMCVQATVLLSIAVEFHGSELPMAECAAAEWKQHQEQQRAQYERRQAPGEVVRVVQPSGAAAAAGPGPGGLTGWGAMEQRRQELLAPATRIFVDWLRQVMHGQLPAEWACWAHQMERLMGEAETSSGSGAAAALAELGQQWRQKLAFIVAFTAEIWDPIVAPALQYILRRGWLTRNLLSRGFREATPKLSCAMLSLQTALRAAEAGRLECWKAPKPFKPFPCERGGAAMGQKALGMANQLLCHFCPEVVEQPAKQAAPLLPSAVPNLLSAEPSHIKPFSFGTSTELCPQGLAYFNASLLGLPYKTGSHGGKRRGPQPLSFQRHQLEAVSSEARTALEQLAEKLGGGDASGGRAMLEQHLVGACPCVPAAGAAPSTSAAVAVVDGGAADNRPSFLLAVRELGLQGEGWCNRVQLDVHVCEKVSVTASRFARLRDEHPRAFASKAKGGKEAMQEALRDRQAGVRWVHAKRASLADGSIDYDALQWQPVGRRG